MMDEEISNIVEKIKAEIEKELDGAIAFRLVETEFRIAYMEEENGCLRQELTNLQYRWIE